MDTGSDKERRGLRTKFTEYAIGFGLLLKGWDEAAQFDHFPIRVILIFIAGGFIIACATLQSRLGKKIKNVAGLFHILEGLVEIACASILLEKDKYWIPIFLAFIGLSYLTKGLSQYLGIEKNREKLFLQIRIIQGIASVTFGAVAIVVNAITDRKIEVYGVAGLIILIGIFILLRRISLSKKKNVIVSEAHSFLNRK